MRRDRPVRAPVVVMSTVRSRALEAGVMARARSILGSIGLLK
jgi:hypothetical protein